MSLPCGLVAGKSLMLLTIVVENSLGSSNGRLSVFMAITGVFTPVLGKHSQLFSREN
jgi:hypothetical protein